MVHSVSGWTRGVQVKLWDPLRTRAIPERLGGVITTKRYTNPRLPLPLPLPEEHIRGHKRREVLRPGCETYLRPDGPTAIIVAAVECGSTQYCKSLSSGSDSPWDYTLQGGILYHYAKSLHSISPAFNLPRLQAKTPMLTPRSVVRE